MTSLSKLFLGVETGLTGLLALGAGLLTVSEAVIRYLSPRKPPRLERRGHRLSDWLGCHAQRLAPDP